MSAELVTEYVYSGKFALRIDPKGRVPVPAKWRPEGSEGKMIFHVVLTTHQAGGKYLRVMPPSEWNKLYHKLEAFDDDDPIKEARQRDVGNNSEPVKVDTAGRINIPELMMTEADLSGDVILSGVMDKFEIWNPERYRKMKEMDELLLRSKK
jgi:MraZ protein